MGDCSVNIFIKPLDNQLFRSSQINFTTILRPRYETTAPRLAFRLTEKLS